MRSGRKYALSGAEKAFLAMLAGGAAYTLWIKCTGWSIPCIFRRVTGHLCPGCGATTMCLRLMRLDFGGAFRANPFLLIAAPLVLGAMLICRIRGKKLQIWHMAVFAAALVLFGVARNLV